MKLTKHYIVTLIEETLEESWLDGVGKPRSTKPKTDLKPLSGDMKRVTSYTLKAYLEGWFNLSIGKLLKDPVGLKIAAMQSALAEEPWESIADDLSFHLPKELYDTAKAAYDNQAQYIPPRVP